MFSLRDVLERFAMETMLTGGAPDPAGLTELAAALDDMERATADDSPLGRAEAHRRFHIALVALAGHQHLRAGGCATPWCSRWTTGRPW